MLTRGKNVVSETTSAGGAEAPANEDDKINDSTSGKQSSASNKEEDQLTDDKESNVTESGSKLKRAPSVGSETTSPVLMNNKSSRLSQKKTFIMDVSSEDTPLSQRQALSVERCKRKRLKLCETKDEEAQHLHSPNDIANSEEEEEEEEEKHEKREKIQYSVEERGDEERQEEHHDGIRRSTRPRKPIYDFSNASWLIGEKMAKGYPKINSEENGIDDESSRIRRTRRRVQVPAEEEEEEEEEEDAAEDVEPRIRRSTRRMTSPTKDNMTSREYLKREPKKLNDDSCMYSRIKNSSRRLRSSTRDTYSGYTSTVRNAKKIPCRAKRASRYDSSNEDTDGQISDTESEHDEELENTEVKGSRKIKNEDRTQEVEIVDGISKGKYTLRKAQPIDRYQPYEPQMGSRSRTPPRSRSSRFAPRIPYSPAHRTQRKRRQKAQNESSTSSSSSDEERFERRKNKSMHKARNRCLPMNFPLDELGQAVVKDRMKIGSSLADVDPMAIDRNVTFEQVGGLETYIRSLKEMILFPLLYPEVFQKFSIQAPRGVLFYGPPGTGKTLVARCLANECSQKDKRVAFFMRKGADCLSKWVGESERQLRLLFDQAYQMRPSVIFFDEIDGLAPVRSTRQDQIHSSIVSTLLALMDGLDSRGEVIVIGATNRLDAIDPALRRPGRFDREFHFPLPSLPARKEILNIHLKSWIPSPSTNLISYLSQKTVGYCGADLKALCAEAALLALRRRYPQVYESKDKLLLDLSQINVERRDFEQAFQRLVPASQRSAASSGKPLSPVVAPLLDGTFQQLIKRVQDVFPEGVATLKLKGPLSGVKKQSSNQLFPRLLVVGDGASVVTSALLHYMERLPVHRLDLSTLNGLSVRTPEEACVQLFHEARRNVPAIIYLPQVGCWWSVASETVRATFLIQLKELDPELPILLLATDDDQLESGLEDLNAIFHEDDDEVFRTRSFTEEERRKFFQPLRQRCLKPPAIRKAPRFKGEILPVAPPPPPRQLSEVEKEQVEKREEATLRELRIFLREILAKLARNKLFYMFTRPVDLNEVPDYLDVIKQPMDLETMMTKIDLHAYESARDFLSDIDLICSNALEYNPDRDPEDKMIRHRACTLRDTAYALIKAEMDTDFEEQCQEISKTRKARQEKLEPPPANSLEASAAATPHHEINGLATSAEIKLSRSRSRRGGGGWSRGVIRKSAAKKRKTDEAEDCSITSTESAAAPMETSETNTPSGTLQTGTNANGSDAVNSDQNVIAEILDDSQASDAVDTDQPNDDIEPIESVTDAVAKKTPTMDVARLEQILESFVLGTEGWHLEKLLRLFTKLARLIDRFLKLWDRTSLVEEVENILNCYVQTTPKSTMDDRDRAGESVGE